MLIGSMIKKLRLERNMTQEQLAECLGVSTNAVSQWERDVTAPDISNIPLLANIFEVSADVLFGIDIAKSKKAVEIEKFIEKENELHSLGKTDARIELCREMRKKYPNDETVLYYLMRTLQIADGNADEVIELGERLIDSKNTEYRYGAIRGLCFTYLQDKNDRNKALEYAEMVPEAEDLRVHVLEGKELVEHCQAYFWKACDRMYLRMRSLLSCKESGYSTEERHSMQKALYDMFYMIFPNEDFGCWEDRLGRLCFFMAVESMKAGEYERAIGELEKMVYHFEKLEDFSVIKHTSPLVNRLTIDRSKHTAKHTEESTAASYLRYLENQKAVFEQIENDVRFLAVKGRLELV